MFINSTRHLSYQFQHTAARRRLGLPTLYSCLNDRFQHTAARRRLGRRWEKRWYALPPVSTHSRPKAAGTSFKQLEKEFYVSTHSRPKAAGRRNAELQAFMAVSTHSRPKAAGFIKHHMHIRCIGFNTQPPEGGWSWKNGCVPMSRVSTHSRPKAAGHCALFFMCLFRMFQHTAARRRLVVGKWWRRHHNGFNTQPPEGGWSLSQKPCSIRFRSPDFARLPRKARTRV